MYRYRKPVRLLLALLVVGLLVLPAGAQEAERHTPREDALIALARTAVRNATLGQGPATPPPATSPAQAVFVTIERGTNGAVIGCRGSLRPRCRSLEEEIVQSARSAAATDPRYRPLSPADLRDFRVTVTLVDHLEPLDRAAVDSLTADDGLVLRSGERTGVVLPYEGKDPRTRLRWAYRKAGVPEGTACTLQRMVARRFRG